MPKSYTCALRLSFESWVLGLQQWSLVPLGASLPGQIVALRGCADVDQDHDFPISTS